MLGKVRLTVVYEGGPRLRTPQREKGPVQHHEELCQLDDAGMPLGVRRSRGPPFVGRSKFGAVLEVKRLQRASGPPRLDSKEE